MVLPRDGSFALAFLGRIMVRHPIFSVGSGRNNLALKRIVDLVSCGLATFIYAVIPGYETQIEYQPVFTNSVPFSVPLKLSIWLPGFRKWLWINCCRPNRGL